MHVFLKKRKEYPNDIIICEIYKGKSQQNKGTSKKY